MSKINLQDTILEVLTKMSNGNPGATVALFELVEHNEEVDPDDFMKQMGSVLSLDTYGIYGTDIYILFNDICNKDVVKMIAVLRATQLGFFSAATLKDACSRQDRSGVEMVPIDTLLKKVKERLPRFNSTLSQWTK